MISLYLKKKNKLKKLCHPMLENEIILENKH